MFGNTPTMLEAGIRYGAARAFFASAYADLMDERHTPLHGEIMDQLPEEWDPAAYHAADTLLRGLTRANGRNVWAVYTENPGGLSPNDWGHYAAMQAMGHGVGLRDYGIKREQVQVPHVEFGSYSLQNDYSDEEE